MIEKSSSIKGFQPTAQGLWKRAKQFKDAGDAVADSKEGQLWIPTYFLWGHSIELSLKAFLFDCGVPLQKLRSKEFGHDLQALVAEAKKQGIERKVHLSVKEIGEISLLSDEYKAKRFEYHETENYYIPFIHRTKRLAAKLVRLIGHAVSKGGSRPYPKRTN